MANHFLFCFLFQNKIKKSPVIIESQTDFKREELKCSKWAHKENEHKSFKTIQFFFFFSFFLLPLHRFPSARKAIVTETPHLVSHWVKYLIQPWYILCFTSASD